jgi:hypothetical protein
MFESVNRILENRPQTFIQQHRNLAGESALTNPIASHQQHDIEEFRLARQLEEELVFFGRRELRIESAATIE